MASETEEFNVIQFEKRLGSLKDSQDHINACCKWCLENRQYHKKIVISWLNVLKRVKIEQRLTLFYLANDVIQYSKRRNYEFVDSWGTALQKATTLVRDDKVKHKIVRIFNIWQQRGVYNEEFISDLCGLISVVPSAPKNDEPHEFQASYVINKIKHCSKLEADTDGKLKVLKEHNPKIQIETDSLCTSLKDRAHVDDVEKELETYVAHLESYINALNAEIKCRINNISVLKQANVQLDKDKKDVKVVANAYKTFGSRVKAFQKKLEEHKVSLSSPIPSPDVNAPSPSPDSDIDLPDDKDASKSSSGFNSNSQFSVGYYNPVPPPPTTQNTPTFDTNGYTSFIGANFNMQAPLFPNSVLQSIVRPPPPPVEAPRAEPGNFNYQQSGGHNMPLLPPPMPPFATNDNNNGYSGGNYTAPPAGDEPNFGGDDSRYGDSNRMYDPGHTNFDANYPAGSYSSADEYNPEQEPVDGWDPNAENRWGDPSTDTPQSPPLFEKESYNRPREYHDNVNASGAADVDHRSLHHLSNSSSSELVRTGRVDIDHRNLISLTGSPADQSVNVTAEGGEVWNRPSDQDYRVSAEAGGDRDYRVVPFNIEQLKFPPPPPPPATKLQSPHKKSSPRKPQDCNVDNIDMELSEDESDGSSVRGGAAMGLLEPPPPLPDLPDDVDANSFLDDLDNDLNSHEFTANLADVPHPRLLPLERNYNNMMFPPPPQPLMGAPHLPPHWMSVQQKPLRGGFPRGRRNGGGGGGGGGGNPRMRAAGRGGNPNNRRGKNPNFNNYNNNGRNFRQRGGGRGRSNRSRGNNNMRGNYHGGF